MYTYIYVNICIYIYIYIYTCIYACMYVCVGGGVLEALEQRGRDHLLNHLPPFNSVDFD